MLPQLIMAMALGLAVAGNPAAQGLPDQPEPEPAVQAEPADQTEPGAREEPETPTEEQPPPRPRERFLSPKSRTLTGDWGGVRTKLEDDGIDISCILTTSYLQNFRGGLETHNADAFSGDVRLNLQLDLDKMGLIPDAFFFIRAKAGWNEGLRHEVGTLGPIHWVVAGGDEEFWIDKWWYGQRFLDDRLEFRVGKLLTPVDLFDAAAYAKLPWDQFLNANLNRSPNIPHRKALGAYMKIKFCDWAYFHMAGVDADQTDSHLFADVERTFHGPANFIGLWEFVITPKFKTTKGHLPGNYRFGLWYDGRTKRRIRDELGGALAPRWRNDDTGWYLTFDQLVWKKNNDPKDKQGLGAFFRYSFAHPETNQVNHFWSIGAQYEGLFSGRDKDVLAFGVAQSIMSKTLRHEINDLADRETIYELYYAYHLTPWCVVSPDLQFITNPGGNKDARDAIVGGVRVKISF
jgi:porin